MANIDGEWACTTNTPMGVQDSILTINSDGSTFTGTNAATIGTAELLDGKIDGNEISWRMVVTSPFSMTLDATATIDGDRLEGTVKAGAFATMVMSGKKVA